MTGRWAWFGIRVVLVTLLALVLIYVPLPVVVAQLIGSIRVPAVVILAVCYVGKLLYDTLFYDHYRP